jgi:microsomal epoxide hydrolase
MTSISAPEPFKIAVQDDVLKDLRKRLALTRWPDEIPDSGWKFGTHLAYMKELVDYWQHQYDWRTHERILNGLDHYRVQFDDICLHFIHQPGVGSDPMPLLLSHGWPGSIYEFVNILGPLTDPGSFGGDPKDAFTIVAPALPGYGFSHVPDQRRLGVEEIGELFMRLMTEVLGYSSFGAQGGDWGAFITARMGLAYPGKVVGIHLNMLPVAPHPSEQSDLTAAEVEFLKEAEIFFKEETGYQWIQGTRPQTLSYALNDSPAGLAAWIVEKFYAWTDCHGDLESRINKDTLLTNIMIYWITQTINSSFWLYYQMRHKPWRLGRGDRINVPVAMAAFPGEILRPPKEWVQRICNLQRWTQMPAGGHFAALEEPDRLVEDIRAFYRDLR